MRKVEDPFHDYVKAPVNGISCSDRDRLQFSWRNAEIIRKTSVALAFGIGTKEV